MARQASSLEVNSFIKGLITEASPLTFPENASLDEDNFVLLRDGSRRRRLGMDFEEDYQSVNTGVTSPSSGDLAFSTYNWENAGGFPGRELLVVQAGANIRVFDLDTTPLSSGQIYSNVISGADATEPFSFDSVDGVLVVACGLGEIFSYSFNGTSISRTSFRLLIRDFFGVEDIVGGSNLREGDDVSRRVFEIPFQHRYNLRNQSWGIPRNIGDRGEDWSPSTLVDPIAAFVNASSYHPSNADSVLQALYPDPSDEGNRTGDQFFPEDLRDNPVGTTLSANGHFIIDALGRGAARLFSIQRMHNQYPELDYYFSSLPSDFTPGGPSCVSQFAGRMWYAGFSGEVVDGDSLSPKMSSYVLYSKLVQSPNDLKKCYQEGDPTSKDAPDLVDTDGGFLRVDGAYRIQKLVNVGKSLMVLAQNGVWMVKGGSDYGFTANNILINKTTDKGVDSPGSVVVVDNTVVFWADDGIYHVKQNEFGDWTSENLTQTTIQTFYEEIDPIDKLYAQGAYDSYDNKIRWVYQNRPTDQAPSRELILDVSLGAFYTATIQTVASSLPKVAAPLLVPPFREVSFDDPVTVQGEQVTVNGEDVIVPSRSRGQAVKETAYLTVLSLNPLRYTFSSYRDQGFRDFRSLNGTGIDAEAYLITGWNGGGDYLRNKQVPYAEFHFIRTEDGFTQDETGNLFPVNESSCIVQAQWNWADSANSNRWGREFQAYRYRRLYSPAGAGDPFDNGDLIISTRNKIRGKGKVVSFYIHTSPDKDCQLLGWSMLMGVTGGI